MECDIDQLSVMASNISINNNTIYHLSRRIITADKKKIAKVYNKIYSVNHELFDKRSVNRTFNTDMCRYIRMNVYQQMIKIKREINFNIRRNINEINQYKIAHNIKKEIIKSDKDLQKIERYKKWRKHQNKKIKEAKEKKKGRMECDQSVKNQNNTRLGSLHRFINREKYIPSAPNNRNIYPHIINIQRIFRGYITKRYVDEHLNIIIKRHIELNTIDDKYINLPFRIKLTFSNLVSGLNKKQKFNEWLTRILNRMNPDKEYIIQYNNILNINILDKMNNGIVSNGYIYAHNAKGTITISNNDMNRIKNFMKYYHKSFIDLFIYTTSRISEQTLNKFVKNGIKIENIFSMDRIIELIRINSN